MTRKAIRKDDVTPITNQEPKQTRQVSFRLFLSTLIFFVVLSCLQFAALVSALSFMFRMPQPATQADATLTPTAMPSIMATGTPEPSPSPTQLAQIPLGPLTTKMFGWFDSSYNDYSFFLDDNLVSGQTYVLCWAGRYIDGDKLTLPIQQYNLHGSGACILAEALPVDKQYKLGFVSQAVRKALIGQRTDWPILELSIYDVPIGNQQLPYPLLHPAVGE